MGLSVSLRAAVTSLTEHRRRIPSLGYGDGLQLIVSGALPCTRRSSHFENRHAVQ